MMRFIRLVVIARQVLAFTKHLTVTPYNIRGTHDMTINEIVKIITQLEDNGLSVVVFTPEELGRLCPDDLRDYLIEKGNEWLAINEGEK